MAKRSGRKRVRPPTIRQFPRTARLNALLQEIVAAHFERADDERIGFLTITGVNVDSDLNVAEVFVSVFGDTTTEEDTELLLILADHRKTVQRDIANEAKLRKTPEVVFAFDPGVRAGARVEEILRQIGDNENSDTEGRDPESSDGSSGE
jgi:ribosome-binding factor A